MKLKKLIKLAAHFPKLTEKTYNNNNNNNIINNNSNMMLCTPKGHPKHFQHFYPLVVTFNSFLKPTQLPGEMQPVQQICATHSAKSITISALTGTHLPLGGENQLQCLAQGHNCHDWDSNPHSHKQKHQGPIS